MHYYIDGYNLLFRLMDTRGNLQSLREQIIDDINRKVSLVKMDVTIVFDAHFQFGDGSRSHFDALEILFTAYGESADEFIVSEIRSCLNPHQETVVTSDKKLAWRVRHKLSHTQSVETFLDSLNKMYKNKLKQLSTPQPAPRKKTPSPIKLLPPVLPIPKQTEPTSQATVEECLLYYEQTFEINHQKLVELVEQEKQKKPVKEKSRRQPKPPKKSPFDEVIENLDAPSAMERWEKIFERKLKE